MTLDLETCMKSLAKKRRIFHSEADFQFALAWKIQQELLKQYSENDFGVRLEYPIEIEDKKANIDIVVFIQGQMIPIELKYLRTDLDSCIIKNENEEEFKLSMHGTGDEGRYDCIKDINRIESISKQESNFYDFYEGYTIWLSNIDDHGTNKYDKVQFNISRGEKLEGTVDWNRDEKGVIINNNGTPKKSLSKDRTEPIKLYGSYELDWKEFSKITLEKQHQPPRNIFRYYLTKINKIQLS